MNKILNAMVGGVGLFYESYKIPKASKLGRFDQIS